MHPFLYSKLLLPIYFFCFQTLEVGFIDAMEFKYVNPKVFYEHNFPDILGVRGKEVYDRGICDAFISGVKCCPILLVPCSIKMLMLWRNREARANKLFKIHAWLSGSMLVADLFVLYTFDSKRHDIYRNHSLWYSLHGVIEIVSLLACMVDPD